MSGQPSVLQVVILRDGLLVGTEVFVPGQFSVGSDPGSDLRLDDGAVAAAHATLFFQNGRVAIQDAGSGAVFVNGHRVNACEVRAVDEIVCGPFTLKVRVLGQKPPAKGAPPPEVSALLGAPPTAPINPSPAPTRGPPPIAAVPPAVHAVAAPPPVSKAAVPSTVVSARRMSTAPQAEPVPSRPHLRPVEAIEAIEELEEATESVALGTDELNHTAPIDMSRVALPPARVTAPPAGPGQATPPRPEPRIPVPSRASPVPENRPAQPARHSEMPAQPRRRTEKLSERHRPAHPPPPEGKGRPTLFLELYWGPDRCHASGHNRIDAKKKLVARDDDRAQVPMWGFGNEGTDFVLAEQKGDLFRLFVPPHATVERRAQDGKFYPVGNESLEVGPGQRKCVTLGSGHALRFIGEKDMTLVAYVQAPLPRPFVNPLRGLPWLVLAFLALFGSAFMAFALYVQQPESPDFYPKNVPPVAVRLIAPPKKEVQKKIEEKLKELKKEVKKKEQPKAEKPSPKPVPVETKKVLKSVEKLVAAGPAVKDLLAAVDKLGAGPGAKNAKNDFKLTGLIGKAPIANAGLGTFGVGGASTGIGIKGAELLRGKGGAGIGALGVGNIGKGRVGGSVTSAVSRNIGAQGSIDKDAVAKAINAHLHEVSSCYERALLREPGLAGKIVLEWQITTSGTVGSAKTKSSTMKSSAVEQCILASLKTWKFPAARGAGVLITYPFMFNSVGY